MLDVPVALRLLCKMSCMLMILLRAWWRKEHQRCPRQLHMWLGALLTRCLIIASEYCTQEDGGIASAGG